MIKVPKCQKTIQEFGVLAVPVPRRFFFVLPFTLTAEMTVEGGSISLEKAPITGQTSTGQQTKANQFPPKALYAFQTTQWNKVRIIA